jgi:tRNA (guanine37-N1)-methyltransferase
LLYFSPVGQAVEPKRWCSKLQTAPGAVLLCGRYEGIDQRFIDMHVDLQISLGDFVLSGGEIGRHGLAGRCGTFATRVFCMMNKAICKTALPLR